MTKNLESTISTTLPSKNIKKQIEIINNIKRSHTNYDSQFSVCCGALQNNVTFTFWYKKEKECIRLFGRYSSSISPSCRNDEDAALDSALAGEDALSIAIAYLKSAFSTCGLSQQTNERSDIVFTGGVSNQ